MLPHQTARPCFEQICSASSRPRLVSAAAAAVTAPPAAAAAVRARRSQQEQGPSSCLHTCRQQPRSSQVCRSAAAAAASDRAQEAAIQQLVSARGLDLDPQLVAQEALLTFSFLSSQPGALPHHMSDAGQLAAHALRLADLMATGSTFMTLQMLKRHPGLLTLTPHQVGERVLQLKLLMPAADVSRLLYQKPTLLLVDDLPGVVGAALNKLHALMPGIPVESKLHEGGTVFWSFSSLIQDTTSSRAAQAAPAHRVEPAAAPGPPPDLAGMAASAAEFHETMTAVQEQQKQQQEQQRRRPQQQ